VARPAFAAKPTDDNGVYLGNGFPSGFHFNLNIHGKKNSNCPDPNELNAAGDYDKDDEHFGDYGKYVDGVWKYSNSLFIPELSGECITIKMQSGNRLKKETQDLPI
jgi:hypothetical protein